MPSPSRNIWTEMATSSMPISRSTAIILFSATLLYRWLGTRVLIAVERLMGMLLVAISVQMFLDGLGTYLNSTI